MGSKVRIGSQDSSEKQVTFQDSNEVSIKKRVKFADDTVFEQAKAKRGKTFLFVEKFMKRNKIYKYNGNQ